jgi:hypothetical protein
MPMRPPNTADERERRFVEYIRTLNKGQLAEVKLRRLNRIANFRKSLMELVNQMIECRAEDLAAGMLMEKAEERPPRILVLNDRPVPAERKRRMPVWVREEAKAARR